MISSDKYTAWQEADGMWLGYLSNYPNYMTQGSSCAELEEMLHDIAISIDAGILPERCVEP